MSRLSEMIKKLCPNGVEYKRIKDCFIRLKGTPITASQMKSIECKDGEIRIFAGGKTVVDAKESDIPNANIIRVPAVLVQSRGVIDFIYYDKPFTFKNEMWAYAAKDAVTVKYLYYYLKNNAEYFREAASGMGSLPQISLRVTEDYRVPLPPLEIQCEIVQILDNFANLTAELTAELAKRKKQYEHYRDMLLNFEGGGRYDNVSSKIEWKKLGEIATIERGNGLQKSDFKQAGLPCIHYGQLYTRFKTAISATITYIDEKTAKSLKRIHTGDILMAVTSENVEDVCKCIAWLGKQDVFVGGHTAIIRHSQDPKYLAYWFQTEAFFKQKKKLAHGTKVIEVTPSKLADVTIPLPPLAEQKRIVAILDRFDALCNSLSEGLPAEIGLRKKQYEYYRDKLLSFKEAG